MKLALWERMKHVIDARAEKRGKFGQLEEMTGIGAESWKSFYYRRQRPTEDMIEAVCLAWPEHAYWIATGLTDSAEGSVGVPIAYETDLNLEVKPQPVAAIQYKRTKAEIQRAMMAAGRNEMTEEEVQTIYAVRSRRESERLDDLNRRTRLASKAGYFDPRLLKFSKIDEADQDGN